MTNATTTPATDAIEQFAASVRAHLADLPAEDADELVEGLAADLAEQAADAGDGFTLPDPAQYAAELRTAAGLAAAGALAPQPKKPGLITRAKAWARRQDERVRATTLGAWTMDLLASLEPAWWVFRGWIAYVVLGWVMGTGTPMPRNLAGWLILVALVVVSAEWGRGQWVPNAAMRQARRIANVGAVLAVPVVLVGLLAGAFTRVEYVPMYNSALADDDIVEDGLYLDGQRIENIFAYGADGQPIDQVRLYDQDGNPLSTVGAIASDDDWTWDHDAWDPMPGSVVLVPFVSPGVAPAWNVFPLWTADVDPTEHDDLTIDQGDVAILPPTLPFAGIPALPVTADDEAADDADAAAGDEAAADADVADGGDAESDEIADETSTSPEE